jgi:hypothetical protein
MIEIGHLQSRRKAKFRLKKISRTIGIEKVRELLM